jgi:hypothetical protein
MSFTFFKQLEKHLKNNVLQLVKLYGIGVSVSINKVVLEHSHAHSFTYSPWWQRQYLLPGPLPKTFANPFSRPLKDFLQ